MSDDLAGLRARIVAHDPVLAGAAVRLAEGGWDSTAVIVGEAWVFRFPNHARAEAALRREARLLARARAALSLAVPDLTLVEGPRPFSRHPMILGRPLLPGARGARQQEGRSPLGQSLPMPGPRKERESSVGRGGPVKGAGSSR